MVVTRSTRYRNVRDLIPKGFVSAKDGIRFLQEHNYEKIKKIKISFFLNCKNKKQELRLETKNLLLPFPIIAELSFLLVLKDGLSDETLGGLAFFERMIKILSVSEFEDYLINRDGKLRKKNLRRIKKVIVCSEGEKLIRFLEKKLAAKGMYPNKKNGWLTEDVLGEVKKVVEKGEQIIKPDKNGNLSFLLGASDWNLDELLENYLKLYTTIMSMRPSGWKGAFLKKVVLSTTMGPGIRLAN